MKTDSEAERLTAEIKEAALKSGADLVGVVSATAIDSLPRVWVSWTIKEFTKKASEVMPNAKSAVVLGYHVWDDMLELAVKKAESWVYPGYFPLDYLMQKTVNHLERKGYEAHVYYSGSCKKLAQLAGFGAYGKNALIINPLFGPWIRLIPVLTNAKMIPDKPFEKDLCRDCEECVKACPVGALSPYKVDDSKCLVGVHLSSEDAAKYDAKLEKYEPRFTRNSHLMCMECQKACKYGKRRR